MSSQRKRIALAMIAALGVIITFVIVFVRASAPHTANGGRSKNQEHHLAADPFAHTERTNVIHEHDARGELALEGLVVGADSQPAPGAIVAIETNPRRVITADESGAFKIDGLTAREYSVSAEKGDEVAGPLRVRVAPTVEPVVINLRPGATLEVKVVSASTGRPVANAVVQLRGPVPQETTTDANGDAKLVALPLGEQQVAAWAAGHGRDLQPVFFGDDHRALAITLKLGEGAKVSGRVIDPAGKPIAGARVSLESAAEPWWHASASEDEVTSDEEGMFAMSSVTLGSYRARAAHPDFVSDTSSLFVVGAKPNVIEVQLQRGVAVRGVVTDSSDKPIAGARVRLSSRGVVGNPREAFSDSAGAFAVTGCKPGHVELAAISNDATSPIEWLEVPPAGVEHVKLVLSNGAEIAGVVVDDKGEPLEGIQVSGWQENGNATWWDLVSLRRELTSSDGRFRLTGLADKEQYAVSADRPETIARGLGMRTSQRRVAAGTHDVRLVVSMPGRVQGIVAYDNGGHPAPFIVRLTGSLRQIRPFSDGTGKFLISEVPPGDYTLTVEGPGFESFHYEGIKVVASSVTDLGTVPARPGRRIEGRVVDAKGRPVAGAKVAAGHVMIGTGQGDEEQGLFAGRSKAAETDADGAFALAGVGRGNVTLIANHPVSGSSLPIELPETQEPTQHVQLVVNAQASISGVVSARGAPQPNTMITAQSTTAPTVLQMVRTGSDGRYSFDRVAADTYAVSVGLGAPMTGMTFIGKTVTLQPGRAVTADLAPVTGAGSLSVTTSFANGNSKIVMLFTSRGAISADNVSQVLKSVTSQGDILWAWNVGSSSAPTVISGLPAGHYTTCVVPFEVASGALPDLASLMRETDLPAHCQGVDVAAAQAKISIAM